jgi:hypothetical protein
MRFLAPAVLAGVFIAAFIHVSPVYGQSKNLAPGFSTLPKGATVAIMPADIELFSISGGGVLEPKADWTEAANRHFKAALLAKKERLGLRTVEIADKDADELAEVNTLHAAVARSIDMHHFGPLSLPTKEGKLDWSLAEAVQPVKKATGADYALFSWVRDSYASAERKAAMIGLALLGVGIPLGSQVGYASLVDLNSGQVVWFNRMMRGTGDLREAQPAAETVDALLSAFPASK